MGHPQILFSFFLFFSNNLLSKNWRLGRIWTWITGIEGEDADYLTTTFPYERRTTGLNT